MPSLYDKWRDIPTHSSELVQPIAPNDSIDLAYVTRGIYVGVTGNVAVEMWDGGKAVFHNAQQGTILPLCVKKVLVTGTTATNLIALY